MRSILLFLIALTLKAGELPPLILKLNMDEGPSELARRFGRNPNALRRDAWQVLQFSREGGHSGPEECEGTFEWEFFFDRLGNMQSVVWNTEERLSAALLFPADASDRYTNDSGGVTATILLRLLPDGRALIAQINSKPAGSLQQVVMMRTEAIPRFFPWLASAMKLKPVQ